MPNVVVIGGGIAGLATAFRLQQDSLQQEANSLRGEFGEPLTCHLVESTSRFGGKVVTDQVDGFVVEGGPDAIIPHKPWGMQLISELGLDDRLLPSKDERRGAFVLHEGRLERIPDGLLLLAPSNWGEFLRSPLLSWPAKLRFALERIVPPQQSVDDESLADFVRRRLGAGALWNLAEPLLAHIHVANIERMSLRATYPRLAALEAKYGSIQRGVSAMRTQHRAAGVTTSPPPVFWALKGGMSELVSALVARLDPATQHLACRVHKICRAENKQSYRVTLDGLDDGRQELEADAVVLATPAYAASDLVADLDPALAAKLRSIPYVSMATLSLGYRRADVGHPMDGFGFFVPRRPQRGGQSHAVLACTWTSTKFDQRAPEGMALLRVFLGGAGNEDLLELDDGEIIHAVKRDLATMMGLDAEPRMTRLYRWPQGYPQYEVGHLERVSTLETALPPGVFVVGSAYHGVGLPDCIRSATEVAQQISIYLNRRPG